MAGTLKVGGNIIASHTGVEGAGTVTLGNVVLGDSAVPTNNYTFRNKIINGDMRIDQRNAGSAISTHSNFVVDRINCALAGGSASGITVQQSSDVPSNSTLKNSIVYTTGTGGSVGATGTYGVQQRIEGYNFSDFLYGSSNAKTFTLSFWVKSSITGSYGIGLRNSAKDRSYIATYEISDASTWEYKTITVSGDTSGTWLSDNGIGLDIFFSLGVGTTYQTTANSWQSGNLFGLSGGAKPVETTGSTFYITGVQLEEGTVATPFEHRPISVELSLCQRYTTTIGGGYFAGNGIGTSNISFGVPLCVPLRAAPSVEKVGGQNISIHRSGNSTNSNATVTVPNWYENATAITLRTTHNSITDEVAYNVWVTNTFLLKAEL